MCKGFFPTDGVQFLNWREIDFDANYNAQATSITLTRGGPKAITPASFTFNVYVYSDNRQNIIISPFGGYKTDDYGGYAYDYGIGVVWKPVPQVEITFQPKYEFYNTINQWVDRIDDDLASDTYGSHYVLRNLIIKPCLPNSD